MQIGEWGYTDGFFLCPSLGSVLEDEVAPAGRREEEVSGGCGVRVEQPGSGSCKGLLGFV